MSEPANNQFPAGDQGFTSAFQAAPDDVGPAPEADASAPGAPEHTNHTAEPTDRGQSTDQSAPSRDEAESLTAMFQHLLNAAEASAAHQSAHHGPAETGLYQLSEAFTALRQDVKLQTKGLRSLQQQSESALDNLREAANRFSRASQPFEAQASADDQADRAARPLARSLADLDEAVQRIGGELDKARARMVEQMTEQFTERLTREMDHATQQANESPRGWRRIFGGKTRDAADELDPEHLRQVCRDQAQQTLAATLDPIAEGFAMMQQRLAQALEEQHIQRVPCVGRPFDPQTMQVMDVVEDAQRTENEVVAELRPGYRWGRQLLRPAEVRAVRRPAASTS